MPAVRSLPVAELGRYVLEGGTRGVVFDLACAGAHSRAQATPHFARGRRFEGGWGDICARLCARREHAQGPRRGPIGLSQRPAHCESIFRLLLKIAVRLPRSCDSNQFLRGFGPNDHRRRECALRTRWDGSRPFGRRVRSRVGAARVAAREYCWPHGSRGSVLGN